MARILRRIRHIPELRAHRPLDLTKPISNIGLAASTPDASSWHTVVRQPAFRPGATVSMTITVERYDWGIKDTLEGVVDYQDVFRALQKSWIEMQWDSVFRRLAIFKPDLTFDFEDRDPTVLARILRASIADKTNFRYALVVPPGIPENRAYAEEYASDVDKAENAVARVFDDEQQALAWLLEV